MRGRVMMALAAGLITLTPAAAWQMPNFRAMPVSAPALTAHYGPDPLEIGDLRVPAGRGPFPVVVLIHGGCWTKGFATYQDLGPLATALTQRGLAVWNIEYRQVGDKGAGWPGSFQDWGRATDYLRVLSRRYRLDLTRVTTVGHSAGAHAALWVAARRRLPRTSDAWTAKPLPIHAAVAIDGPGALEPFVGRDAQVCGKPVIVPLMGGTPAQYPERYKQASPFALQPLGVKQYLVAAAVLDPASAKDYENHGEGLGDTIEVLPLAGSDHFQPITPATAPGKATIDLIVRAATAR